MAWRDGAAVGTVSGAVGDTEYDAVDGRVNGTIDGTTDSTMINREEFISLDSVVEPSRALLGTTGRMHGTTEVVVSDSNCCR